MNRTWSLVAVVGAMILVFGSLELARSAEIQSGPNQVLDGAKKVGQGVDETAKGIEKTVAQGAQAAGKEAKTVADRLHDGAKAFGEAIWDAMKAVGRAMQRAFTGSSTPGPASEPPPAH